MIPTLRAALAARLMPMLARTNGRGSFDDTGSDHEQVNYDMVRFLADQGDASAQNDLGGMYANGRGARRNYAEALKWWRRAAEQGYARAQFSLGLMYEKGDGVPQDFVEAHKWYLIATSRFPTSDPVNSAIASEFGKSLAGRMAPEPIAEAQRRAREWQPTIEAPARMGRGR
jgi:hypothetical protein